MPDRQASSAAQDHITLVIEGPDAYGRILIPRDAREVHVYAAGACGLEARIDGGEDEFGADE